MPERIGPPSVLLCIDRLARAGTQNQLATLARGLVRYGTLRPVVVGLLDGGPVAEDLAAEGLPVRVLTAGRHLPGLRRLGRYAGAALELARLARREDACLLFGNLLYANTICSLAGLVSGLPVAAGERNAVAWKEPAARVRRRLVAGVARCAIANSPASARRAMQAGGFAEDRVQILPNAVDLEHLDLARAELAGAGAPWPASGGPVVGCVANLTRVKGVDLLAEAATRVLQLRPDVLFVVAGEGEERRSLEKQLMHAGIAGRFRLLGSRPDAGVLASAFDVAVLPSRSEGMPNALLEYLAACRPVVAAAVDGVAQTVQHLRHAWLAEPEDPAALADGILRVLEDRVLALRMGREGRALVERRHALERVTAQFERIVRRTVGMPQDETVAGSRGRAA